MARGISTRTTRRRHTSRRSTCRPRCVVRAFTSRDHSGSRRRLRNGSPGGRSCGASRKRSRRKGNGRNGASTGKRGNRDEKKRSSSSRGGGAHGGRRLFDARTRGV